MRELYKNTLNKPVTGRFATSTGWAPQQSSAPRVQMLKMRCSSRWWPDALDLRNYYMQKTTCCTLLVRIQPPKAWNGTRLEEKKKIDDVKYCDAVADQCVFCPWIRCTSMHHFHLRMIIPHNLWQQWIAMTGKWWYSPCSGSWPRMFVRLTGPFSAQVATLQVHPHKTRHLHLNTTQKMEDGTII